MKVAICVALCMIALAAGQSSFANERSIKPLLAREPRDTKWEKRGTKKRKETRNYCEKCKTCAYYKKSRKTARWMIRNKNINKIFRKLNSRFKKAPLFNKGSLLIKRYPCTQHAMEVQVSLERCNKTVSSICNHSEFREVNQKALKCMKQKNCKWIPKFCNLKKKDFDRINQTSTAKFL